MIGDNGLLDYDGGDLNTIQTTDPESGGIDVITTGIGQDFIFGGSENDTVNAGDGINVVGGDNATATLSGGFLLEVESLDPAFGGDDIIFTGVDNDLIIGGRGNDTVHASSGNDLLFGDNALISGDVDLNLLPLAGIQPFTFISIFTQNTDSSGNSVAGDDTLFGDAGEDILLGQQGSDALFGGIDDDDIIGGHNVSVGHDSDDVIDTGSGDDVVAGDNAVITRTGLTSSTRFRSLTGGIIYDANGTLLVTGSNQEDPNNVAVRAVLLLDHSDTPVSGTSGNDYITGGADNDVVLGQLGDDVLHGDYGITVTVEIDGTVNLAALRQDLDGLTANRTSAGDVNTDGDDYIEGNGGNDLVFGGLGQDDIVGDNSSFYGLAQPTDRPVKI